MKKTVLTLLTLFAMVLGAAAQDNEIPAYRNVGYKGNVSYTNIGVTFHGIETSHGYMFNDRFYLGGGVDVLYLQWSKTHASVAGIFADTEAYWFHKRSTLTSGVRARFLADLESGVTGVVADLTVGWSWGFRSGQGLTLKAGLTTLPSLYSFELFHFVVLSPMASLTFEF